MCLRENILASGNFCVFLTIFREMPGALFSHSPRAKEIYQERAKEQAFTAHKPPHRLSPHNNTQHLAVTRQQSIITLTTSSSSPTPPQGGSTGDIMNQTYSIKSQVSPLTSIDSVSTVGADPPDFKQRQIIATSTRNIHALALKRRSMDPHSFSQTHDRYEEVRDTGRARLGRDDPPGTHGETIRGSGSTLTESLLEQHNKQYANYAPKRPVYKTVASEGRRGGETPLEASKKKHSVSNHKVYGRATVTGKGGGGIQQQGQRSRSHDKHMAYQQVSALMNSRKVNTV